MTVVVLAGRLRNAMRLIDRLGAVDGIRLGVCVSRNTRRSAPVFALILVHDLLRLGPRRLRLLLRLTASRRLVLTTHKLHDRRVLARIGALSPDVGLHNVDVIYRESLLKAFRLGVLNPHIGLLPAYRGRSVMEWTLLHGDQTGITTFFMDEGIDTGPRIVLRESVDVSGYGDVTSAKAHLFSLDGEMYARALERLCDPTFEPVLQSPAEGRRWYEMSALFTDAVNRLLAGSVDASTSAAELTGTS